LEEGDIVAAAMRRGAQKRLRAFVEHPFAERL
jgi:hypothetical protein